MVYYLFCFSNKLVFEAPHRKLFFFFPAQKKHKFVNYAHLTVYANPSKDSFSEQTKDEIHRIFLDTLIEHRIELEYPRILSEEEISFYGFQNKPKSEWNKDVIIPDSDAAENVFRVELEDFESLAVYHVLSNFCKALCRNKTLAHYNARVYCGWDDKLKIMRHIITVHSYPHRTVLIQLSHTGGLKDELYEMVKKHDKCDVLTKKHLLSEVCCLG